MKKLAAFLALLVFTLGAGAQISLQHQGKGSAQQGRGKFIRQGDGTHIYLTATGGNFYSCKLFPNGDLDDMYNGVRSSKKTYGKLINCKTITAQHDKWGRLLIAGSSCADSNSGRVATMVRLTKSGDPDVDFTPVIAQLKVGDSSEFIGIYLLPDEKIMALGACYMAGGYHFFLSRFQYNGEKDPTFGENGVIIDKGSPADFKPMLTAQPDGKYLVAGSVSSDKELTVIKRYNADGNTDTTFGDGGAITLAGQENRYMYPTCLLLQADGKILVGGNIGNEKKGGDIFVARLDTGGAPDTSFGKQGIVKTGVATANRLDDIAVLPDGKIILSGAGAAKGDARYNRYIMLRLSPDGKVEKGYGYGSEKGLPPIAEGMGYTTIANHIAISPHGNKVNRIREYTGGNETETLLTFTTYLQDSALGIMDLPVAKLQDFVYPIPVAKSVTFSFELIDDMAVTVKLTDTNGGEIATIKNKEPYVEGDNTVSINFPPNSKQGKYLVILSSEAGYKITIEVTKI